MSAQPEEDWCDHCDLRLSECEHGRPTKHPMRLADLVATGPTIEANETSPCAACEGKIRPGQSITYTDEGWAHTEEVLPTGGPPPTDPSTFEGI